MGISTAGVKLDRIVVVITVNQEALCCVVEICGEGRTNKLFVVCGGIACEKEEFKG